MIYCDSRLLACFLVLLGVTGCTAHPSPTQSGIGGGILGAAVGAGVGSLITNGNVGHSAALGGAIGVPVGVAYALAIEEIEEAQRQAVINDIRERQALISVRDGELAQMSKTVRSEHPEEQGDYPPVTHFTGPTLGNRYR